MSKIIGITVGTPINPEKFNSGGGESFTLVQETGDGETAVMSQKATTKELSKFSILKVTTGADMENHPFVSGRVVATIYPTDGNGEIFVPVGWKALIRYVIDPLTETSETATATDIDITKKITFSGEQYISIDISRLDGLSSDKNDCPVTITQSKSRIDDIEEQIGDIEEQIGDIDKALDELHAYAQALISGGVAE